MEVKSNRIEDQASRGSDSRGSGALREMADPGDRDGSSSKNLWSNIKRTTFDEKHQPRNVGGSTGVPLICGFSFHGFSYPQTTMV